MLAALQEEGDGGTSLMDAARRLAGGLSDLLNAVQPERQEVEHSYYKYSHRIKNAKVVDVQNIISMYLPPTGPCLTLKSLE